MCLAPPGSFNGPVTFERQLDEQNGKLNIQMIDPNNTDNLSMRFAPHSASGDLQKRCRTALCPGRGPKIKERDIMSSSAPFSERGNGSYISSKT